VATIYYLNWDQEHRTNENRELGPAGELFHKLNVESVLDEDGKPGNSYTADQFRQLYREIADIDVDDPEDAWAQWNAGSGHETQEFYNAEVRSMSVGDVIEINGTYHQAKAIGWDEIEVTEP
jgi:hypothetical protein